MSESSEEEKEISPVDFFEDDLLDLINGMDRLVSPILSKITHLGHKDKKEFFDSWDDEGVFRLFYRKKDLKRERLSSDVANISFGRGSTDYLIIEFFFILFKGMSERIWVEEYDYMLESLKKMASFTLDTIKKRLTKEIKKQEITIGVGLARFRDNQKIYEQKVAFW